MEMRASLSVCCQVVCIPPHLNKRNSKSMSPALFPPPSPSVQPLAYWAFMGLGLVLGLVMTVIFKEIAKPLQSHIASKSFVSEGREIDCFSVEDLMEGEENWSVAVEDLIDNGDVEGAISLLQSLISKLETLTNSSYSSDLRLATVLTDLANLYSSQGFSIKADEHQTRAFLIKQKALQIGDLEATKSKDLGVNKVFPSASACDDSASSDDDWEAVADRGPDEIFTTAHDAGISELSLEDTELETPKRRGRGSFLYQKNSLYSDQQPTVAKNDYSDDEEVGRGNSEENSKVQKSKYGTSHVLVLADFPPSTRTTELEKLFENFRDRGVVIRWVNDTVALAVFRTPSIALEAQNSVQCPFKVRVLGENDSLLSSVSTRDLEPPYPRPKTSVTTAQRLIAQGMGRKLSTNTPGSSEFKKQEEARKNRIVTRQILKDDAWGAD